MKADVEKTGAKHVERCHTVPPRTESPKIAKVIRESIEFYVLAASVTFLRNLG